MARTAKTRTAKIQCPEGMVSVECFGGFDYEIAGRTFRFLVTGNQLNKAVTHEKSGLRVAALSVGAYLPGFKRQTDTERAKESLKAVIEKHGATVVRDACAKFEPEQQKAVEARDAAGNVIAPMDRFEQVLAEQYRDLFANSPDYAHAKQTISPEELAKRMTRGLAAKTANKDGDGIKRTCKALGIKYTYAAIRAYLATPATSEAA